MVWEIWRHTTVAIPFFNPQISLGGWDITWILALLACRPALSGFVGTTCGDNWFILNAFDSVREEAKSHIQKKRALSKTGQPAASAECQIMHRHSQDCDNLRKRPRGLSDRWRVYFCYVHHIHIQGGSAAHGRPERTAPTRTIVHTYLHAFPINFFSKSVIDRINTS